MKIGSGVQEHEPFSPYTSVGERRESIWDGISDGWMKGGDGGAKRGWREKFSLGRGRSQEGGKASAGFETSNQTVMGIPESEGNEGSDVLCPGTRVLEQGEQQGRGWICAVDC